jgi:uncharacterized OB-fold protein
VRERPDTTPDTEFFWQAGHDGVLRILGCARCLYLIHPPAPYCPACGSREVRPRDVSGLGTVFAHTVVAGGPPTVVAIVELAEQSDLRLMTSIVGCPAENVEVGQAVEVTFEPCDDLMIPLFQLREPT